MFDVSLHGGVPLAWSPVERGASGSGAAAGPADSGPAAAAAPTEPRGPAAAAAPAEPRPVLPMTVVADARVRAALPWVGRLAYVMLGGGFLMTDIFWLRCLLTGGYSALTCFHIFQLRPLHIPLCGSFLFVCVNAGMAMRMLQEWYLTLDEEERDIYRDNFGSTMSTKDFKKLMARGEVALATEHAELIRAGEEADLVLVLEGRAEVVLSGGRSVFVEGHGLVGEASFVSGSPASATALAVPGSRYVVWRRGALKRLLAEEPALERSLELRIGQELIRKLACGMWLDEHLRTEGARPGIDDPQPRPTPRAACL